MDNSTRTYAQNTSATAEEAAARLKNKATEMAETAKEKIGDAVDEVQTRAKEAGDMVLDYANQAADKLDESLKTRPMTTLVGAMAVGFVLGALWKR